MGESGENPFNKVKNAIYSTKNKTNIKPKGEKFVEEFQRN
jgi:hypothetical protein